MQLYKRKLKVRYVKKVKTKRTEDDAKHKTRVNNARNTNTQIFQYVKFSLKIPYECRKSKTD